jgi:Domain of unknown function (DUF4062)
VRKKYQVFISSTYEDLKEERQAAVEAVLKSGNIPAGMELFTAGSQSQYEVILRWIDDSDIFMLILGGRYGSIEPSSGLSYMEAEFNYARKTGKPFFSIVLSDEGKEAKVRRLGTNALEQTNEAAYRNFRAQVVSQLCAFFKSPQDVKLAVLETLPQLAASHDLVGWVSGKEIRTDPAVASEMARLSKENQDLRSMNEKLERQVTEFRKESIPFRDLAFALDEKKIKVPDSLSGKKEFTASLLDLTLFFSNDLARGVSNAMQAPEKETFLFYSVASALVAFGLAEEGKVPSSVHWQRLKLSKEGVKFVAQSTVETTRMSFTKSEVNAPAEATKTASHAPTKSHPRKESDRPKQKAPKKPS